MDTEAIKETNNAMDPAHLREDVTFNVVQVTGNKTFLITADDDVTLSFINHHPSFPTDDMYLCKNLGQHFVCV